MPITDDEILALSRRNPLHRFERSSDGELVVSPPTGTAPSRGEGELFFQGAHWNKHARLGFAFPSTAGFRLPNSALRAPDAAWIARVRWTALSESEREGFARICPDAAFELLSPSDDIERTRVKLHEYVANGAQLAVLLDPRDRIVEVARPALEREPLRDPVRITLAAVLPGFVLDVRAIFAASRDEAG